MLFCAGTWISVVHVPCFQQLLVSGWVWKGGRGARLASVNIINIITIIIVIMVACVSKLFVFLLPSPFVCLYACLLACMSESMHVCMCACAYLGCYACTHICVDVNICLPVCLCMHDTSSCDLCSVIGCRFAQRQSLHLR